MTTEIIIVFAIIVLAAVFFVWGKIRSDIVALCAMVALMLFGILTPEEGLSGFSNSVVIMMACLFIVGGGIFQTGLAKMISTKILAFAGNSELKLFVLVMLVTGGIGAFVSNTGTVALMLPIVISLTMEAKTDARRFLMPMAFASSLGLLTLISTPPNLIINDTLVSAGYEGLSFFAFLPVGLITLTLGIILLWPLSKLLVSKKNANGDEAKKKDKSLKQLASEYQLADNLYRVKVKGDSPFVNKMLQDLNITRKYNVSVLEIRRINSQRRFHKTVDMKMAGPGSTVRENDILYIFGKFENVETLVDENNLTLIDTHESEGTAALSVSKTGGLEFGEIGIAEVVLMSTSKIVNKPVRESGFRQLYNVNILGIQRKDEYILQDIKDEKMLSGDVLLVQGKWSDIEKLNQESSEWVVVGQPMEKASKIPLDHKAPVAAVIMLLMVLSMAFNIIPPVVSALIASILMILTGCFRNVESAYKTINWESIFLFAGMFPLAIAMEKTGASALIANGIVNGLGSLGPTIVLAGVYLATSILTMFISNTATAVLFAPIALQAALTLGVSPYPFLFAVTVAASMCFASPFSTPPNALVMSAGRYKFMDYIKVGLPLQIVVGIVMVFILPLLFPF
ncbi:SLC13 family permease [Paludibacter sp. 221]|nr:SLC13 family permease [Paludibacter sp. 221]NDV47045.1 SLC13 family permease [Paludibacter sp. 221]